MNVPLKREFLTGTQFCPVQKSKDRRTWGALILLRSPKRRTIFAKGKKCAIHRTSTTLSLEECIGGKIVVS